MGTPPHTGQACLTFLNIDTLKLALRWASRKHSPRLAPYWASSPQMLASYLDHTTHENGIAGTQARRSDREGGGEVRGTQRREQSLPFIVAKLEVI